MSLVILIVAVWLAAGVLLAALMAMSAATGDDQ
jgi:hypothetical protein